MTSRNDEVVMMSSSPSMCAFRSRIADFRARSAALVLLLCVAAVGQARAQTGGGGGFSLEQILSYPYTEELTSSDSGARIAWVFILTP